jgi:hypothetical protein
MQLFGLSITLGKKDKEKSNILSVVPPAADDGSAIISSINASSYYGMVLDVEGVIKNENDLIRRYREVAQYPDCDSAIEDIINEVIMAEDGKQPVEIILDDLKLSESIKKKIVEEFKIVLQLLKIDERGHDMFRTWYIDGRLYYHVMIDENNIKDGIAEMRSIDPRKIRRIKNVIRERQPGTNVEVVKKIDEYYLFNDKGITEQTTAGVKLSLDSVVYTPSGLVDANTGMMLSFLHKAIKPVNQLKLIEDSLVIYRVSRAPERRIFYIDVGNLPKIKAEQYVNDVMNRFRNKVVYDASTGETRDDRKFMSMLEDFWMPRREGCFSLDTKIKVLDGRDVELGQLIVEHKLGKQNWVYSVSPEGKVVPGKISWAGVTRTDAEVIKVTLDNGEVITCTPDHKFILRNGDQIEARLLQTGSSLMPCNTEKRVLYGKTEYEYIQQNIDESWMTTHKMVSSYINRPIIWSEVVHHADFDRYNNNPDNLVIMDKKKHFAYHGMFGSANKSERWHKNLSESGKKFFDTEAGTIRKQEISDHNKICKEIWEGAAKGRSKVKEMRASDKQTLSDEEYLLKWSPGMAKMQLNNTKVAARKHQFNFSIVESVVQKLFHRKLQNKEVILELSNDHPEMNYGLLGSIFRSNGYDNFQDYVSRKYGTSWYKCVQSSLDKHNHKVVSIEFSDVTMDVGTLTIDENHEYHDYHNFALTSGVFVMNSKGTEITTLPGGQSLGVIDDIVYFQNKLFQALNVPIGRLKPDQVFSLGKSSEITREEVKFSKFIGRLRKRFSTLFKDTLRVQLISKGIIRPDEWEDMRSIIRFDFVKDNYFSELKDNEILIQRVNMLQQVDPYVGKYYSTAWIRKHVLQQSEEDIKDIDTEMKDEQAVLAANTATPEEIPQEQQGEEQ